MKNPIVTAYSSMEPGKAFSTLIRVLGLLIFRWSDEQLKLPEALLLFSPHHTTNTILKDGARIVL